MVLTNRVFCIATSITNLAFGQLQKALVMQEQSLVKKRAICGTYAAHHEIVYSFHALSNVHALLGCVQKTIHYHNESSEMSRVISDRTSGIAQPDLAAKNDEVAEMRVSCHKEG